MDEEVTLIDTRTRNEKIKNFIIKNKKKLISVLLIIIILILGFYSYQIFRDNHKQKLSDKYNSAVIEYGKGNKSEISTIMKDIIEEKDSSYSPLALYFIIDNKLIDNREEINNLFEILIQKTSLENEIKNLIIYKKALYNADFVEEKELLDIVKPLLNSNSVWKSHALYVVGEYFYSKGEKQKSKEFFNQIISLDNVNQDLAKEAQKRLNRDLSE
jgi:hypothetical protein|tara:strand:- start:195 stop:839 length:645 start_codon:yes stop_codon:yes gene_type:complete